MNEATPRISFGVPVRNGADTIDRCLESIAGQHFEDFEVIVSDNASTDDTRRRVEAWMDRDSRIRLVRQPRNVGLIENFNHVARESRGELFRWVGADDWLEPEYASSCVGALDAQPQALAATSGFDLVYRDGTSLSREWTGEFLESRDPHHRLLQLLGFFHGGLGLYEPVYSMIRREAIFAAGLVPIHRHCDWLFVTALCLAGPFVHVPKRLFHRGWSDPDRKSLAGLAARLHPIPQQCLEPSILNLYAGLARCVARAELSSEVRAACQRSLVRFMLKELSIRVVGAFRTYRRSIGVNRDLLTRFSGPSGRH